MFRSRKKDGFFFDAFSRHAASSVEAAKLFVELLAQLETADPRASGMYRLDVRHGDQNAIGRVIEIAQRIKATETIGDTITHDTMKRVHESWITPLDRYDIHQLISTLDDVLDFIEEAADRTALFQVHFAPPPARELAGLVVSACEAMEKAIALLPTMTRSREIMDLCEEINRLENVADNVHRRAIAQLFEPGNDPLVVMKWRDIFESLESAADRCEDVADVLEGVVLEYA